MISPSYHAMSSSYRLYIIIISSVTVPAAMEGEVPWCSENYNKIITISSNILLATLPGAHNHIIIIMASYHHRIIILSWLTGTFPPWQIPTMVGFCPWWLWWESVSDKIPPLIKMMKNFNFLINWLSSTDLKYTFNSLNHLTQLV